MTESFKTKIYMIKKNEKVQEYYESKETYSKTNHQSTITSMTTT